jgi:ribonuclease BN (tRNA processing enzyme)
MRLTVLGSGGWIPTAGRETCSALVEDGGQALLLDAGSGVRHLVERPELLRGHGELHVLLTHFHGDHTVGISYLPALPVERVVVHGPGRALYGAPTREILERVFSRPQAAFELSDVVAEVMDVGPGTAAPGGIEVELRRQEMHADPTLGVRVGDRYAWCTDTGPDPETASFARGVDLLFHDMWETAAHEPTGHTSGADCGRLATEAGAGALVGIHLNPLPGTDHEAVRAEAAAFCPRALLGADLQTY